MPGAPSGPRMQFGRYISSGRVTHSRRPHSQVRSRDPAGLPLADPAAAARRAAGSNASPTGSGSVSGPPWSRWGTSGDDLAFPEMHRVLPNCISRWESDGKRPPTPPDQERRMAPERPPSALEEVTNAAFNGVLLALERRGISIE